MMKKLYLIIISLGLISFLSQAQEIDSLQWKQLLLDLEILSADSLEGRYTATKGSEKARTYIIKRLQQIGVSAYTPNYEHKFEFYSSRKKDSIQGTNILGFINGSGEDIIVLSAHYDHLGKSGENIFNGADDNASGVASLLFIASYFVDNQPENNLLLAFFDAEEHGKKGADAFTNSVLADTFNIKLNINLDMVARGDKNQLYASGTYHYPYLKPYIEQIAKGTPIQLLMGHDNPKSKSQQDWTNSSDHAAFHALKIPFIYFGVEDHPDYHKSSDTFEKVNPLFYYQSSSLLLESVKLFDAELQKIKQVGDQQKKK